MVHCNYYVDYYMDNQTPMQFQAAYMQAGESNTGLILNV